MTFPVDIDMTSFLPVIKNTVTVDAENIDTIAGTIEDSNKVDGNEERDDII